MSIIYGGSSAKILKMRPTIVPIPEALKESVVETKPKLSNAVKELVEGEKDVINSK